MTDIPTRLRLRASPWLVFVGCIGYSAAALADGESAPQWDSAPQWEAEPTTPQTQTLVPPPPPPPPAETETVRELEQAEREDSGRGLQFVWLALEAGFDWVSLALISNNSLIDESLVEGDGIGPRLSAGAGVRLLYLTAGARFNYALLSEFDLWSVGGDVALRVPRGRWEPFAQLGVGYARAQAFDALDAIRALGDTQRDLSMSGIDARLGGGIDYFVTPVFSVGANAEAEFLFLGRKAVLEAGEGGAFAERGNGIGLGASASVRLGLHF